MSTILTPEYLSLIREVVHEELRAAAPILPELERWCKIQADAHDRKVEAKNQRLQRIYVEGFNAGKLSADSRVVRPPEILPKDEG